MRDIVFDTETTGLDPAGGHRVVEIAGVELINLMPTGLELHVYCNPEREMPEDALQIHGLTTAFLADKPLFAEIADQFSDFVSGARLVAHNAEFDMRFLQAEFARCGRGTLDHEVVDTLALARRKFPGAPASLDALCRRFQIDLSERSKHGALIDTRLLAKVYLELMGGQQPNLALGLDPVASVLSSGRTAQRLIRLARPHQPLESELSAHQALVAMLKNPLWHES
jgi:DNA polymerase III subunit epsilon